jgi:drug/metabolite transporter (DMT)-like permease
MTRDSRRTKQGVALVVLSACCFGAMVLFGRWAYADGVAPASLLFMRFAIAAPILGALVLWRGSAWPQGRSAWISVLMGGVFVGNSLAYFVALSHAPAATVAIVFFAYPAIVTVVVWLFFRETLGIARIFALLLALAGCVATLGPTALGNLGGAWFALLAAAIYTLYILLARGIAADTDPLAQATVITAVAALLLGAITYWQGFSLPSSSQGWGAVAALALVSTVVAISAFLAGAARLGSTGAATLSAAEPVVAAILATLVLDEPLHLGLVLGVGLILASTLLIVNSPASGKQVAAAEPHASG